ncbi:hypothetical protein CDL15_Pgr021367 [Punica granatum]|uniref:Uncharacterized protein n=1 Tax=Punica granatum TaxID=22663 RepID=A0A218WQV6_PUNGR|nr:hypothetical protein CDL15_Pgr021367 [Punica granatum]
MLLSDPYHCELSQHKPSVNVTYTHNNFHQTFDGGARARTARNGCTGGLVVYIVEIESDDEMASKTSHFSCHGSTHAISTPHQKVRHPHSLFKASDM